jgi:hypothetical protein
MTADPKQAYEVINRVGEILHRLQRLHCSILNTSESRERRLGRGPLDYSGAAMPSDFILR